MTPELRRTRSAPPYALPLYIASVLALSACDVKVGEKGMSVGVARETASEQWTRSYTLSPDRRLAVTTFNGPTTITGGTGPETEIRIDREATAMTKDAARELLASASIAETTDAEGINIEVQRKDSGPAFRPLSIRTNIRVARGVKLMVRTQNGPLTIENVDGDLTAAATNGSITGHGISGRLTANVVNGRMAIDLASISGNVRLSSTNGGIGIGVSEDLNADFDLMATNGGVSVDSQVKLTAKKEEANGGFFTNRLSGQLNRGGPDITAQATNGGIRVGPPGTGAGRGRGR